MKYVNLIKEYMLFIVHCSLLYRSEEKEQQEQKVELIYAVE